jgi:hypothetical protein
LTGKPKRAQKEAEAEADAAKASQAALLEHLALPTKKPDSFFT